MKQAEYDLETASVLRDAGRFDAACSTTEEVLQAVKRSLKNRK